MIESYNRFNMIDYNDVETERENIVSAYGDEPHELLLAEVTYEDASRLNEFNEFLEINSTTVSLVPVDDFNDFITEKLTNDQVISEVMMKKRAGIWPYTAITIDMDKIAEEAKYDLGVEEIYLDGTEYCVFENV